MEQLFDLQPFADDTNASQDAIEPDDLWSDRQHEGERSLGRETGTDADHLFLVSHDRVIRVAEFASRETKHIQQKILS